MPKLKLTNTSIQLAYCPEGKSKECYWDTEIGGLTLEVRPSGATYYFRYNSPNGSQRAIKLGRLGDLTVEQVRKEAKRLRAEVALGGDPWRKKEEQKAVPTYAELATLHLDHAKTYQRSFETTEMYMKRHILPRWSRYQITDIHQRDVAQWLAKKAEDGLAPATVEKIRLIFGRSFELALQWNMGGAGKNPTRGIKRPPINNARERFLSAEEAARLHQAVARSKNTQLRFIVGLLLLTGARVSELLNAEWRHIDVKRRTWLIPTSKTGKARHVPLSTEALNILAEVPRFENCPYVLPNPATKKPFTDIKHAWQNARREAGLRGLRIHDLRHSAASFMINSGVDLFAVGRVLGHADHKSTMRYSHLAHDTLLAAVEAGAKRQAVDWAAPA